MDHSEWVCPWVVMWPTAMAVATITVDNVLYSEDFRCNIIYVSIKPFCSMAQVNACCFFLAVLFG